FITPVSESVCHIYISALAYVPEQSWIANQFWKDFENRLKIGNTEGKNWKGTQRYTRGHTRYVRSVTFSSDDKYVASGSDDGTVRIWDVETGQQRGTEFKVHTGSVTSVAFSSDDKYVVAGSDDCTVRIWDVKTGQQRGTEFKGHTGWVRSVAFSSDDKYVVSGSNDKTVRIWDVETGQQSWDTLQANIQPTPSSLLNSIITPQLPHTLTQNGNKWSCLSPPPTSSIFLADGWYYANNKRLLWVPPLYRNAVINSQIRSFPMDSENPTLFVNIHNFVHGLDWTSIKTQP
ncbi:WD40 repeat-like protein, partial [Pluteus cervinus]